MINRKELKRLERQFPYVKNTEADKDWDFLEKNEDAAIWLCDNSDLLLEILRRYHRITEITFEGEKLNE